MSALTFLWRNRRLIWGSTRSDVKARYTGSVLGMGWALMHPLLFLGAYVVVFLFAFRIRPEGMTAAEYVLVMFTGLVPWLGFSEAISASVSSVTSNANLLQSTFFPAPALPVKAVLCAMFTQVFGLCILLAALSVMGRASLSWLFLPLAVGTQILLSFGLGWLLSVLNVFVRDLGQAISVILLFTMLISPIAYIPEMLGNGPLRLLIWFNPIHYLILLYRQPLFYGQLPDIPQMILAFGVSLFVFFLGYRFFIKVQPHLVDYV